MDLHVDFETRSAVDLKKTGVHVYAEDPTTEIWCMAYAFGDDEPEMWLPGEPVPAEVFDHVDAGGPLVAHNAAFEITIWREILAARHGFPQAPAEQWRCTMAQAYAMALPGALGDAAGALGLDQAKDLTGHRLMLSMAKPRKVIGLLPAKRKVTDGPDADGWQEFIGADGLPLKIRWWVDEDRHDRLREYCKQDIRTERALDKRLLKLRPLEQKIWVLDQKINDRGVVVDELACQAAMDVVNRARIEVNLQMRHASNYEVNAATAVSQIIAFLLARGVEVPGLAKDQVTEMLGRDDLPEDCRQVLELRQKGSKMAVSKIQALLNGRSKDGRAKGLTQYHAASTGRWGGRRFQPQNLKRPDLKQDEIERLIRVLRSGNHGKDQDRYDLFCVFADDPIEALGDCTRALIGCPPGQIMGSADFSNIEGRVLAWLTGESWKVAAFRDFDSGAGPDLYKLAFSRSFGKTLDAITADDRQVGKVQELALGYQGGPGAFQTMARGYGVDIGPRYDQILEQAEPTLVDEAFDAWETYGKSAGMSERNWIAAEVIKRAWRQAHPATVAFWSDIEAAAIRTVESPGTVFRLGKLRFRTAGSFLFMQLPSGRCLCYPYPKIKPTTTSWGATKHQLTFFGQDTYTRKWGTTSTYGGKLTENAVQAIARDLLAEALLRLDDAGVEVVLHVHDEAVFYDDEDVLAEVCRIMENLPSWAEGLPVAAAGWVGNRYRK